MHPPRFRIRTLLIVVALVGLIAGGVAEYPKAMRRRASDLNEARFHARRLQDIPRAQHEESLNLAFWTSLATARDQKARGMTSKADGDHPPREGESWASLAEQARQPLSHLASAGDREPGAGSRSPCRAAAQVGACRSLPLAPHRARAAT